MIIKNLKLNYKNRELKILISYFNNVLKESMIMKINRLY